MASIDGLRKLHANGVRLVAGGDFGHQWTEHGTYAAELASYVELLGFSPLEALITATSNAGPLPSSATGAKDFMMSCGRRLNAMLVGNAVEMSSSV